MNDVDGKFFRGEPFIPRRGVMIDLARVVETPEFVISQLPFYASSHLNCLYLHFENKLRYPSSPDWAHPCAWEMADLRRVIAAAAEWKIECIPVIASVGHQESLLIHPRYRKFAAPGTMDHLNVSDPEAASIFGVTRSEVLRHYTRDGLVRRNRKKEEKSEMMLEKLTGGLTGWVRLDTVMTSGGEVCYRYTQTVESRPGLKKIPVTISGGIYEDGRLVYSLPGRSRIDFYVSSLSTLADLSPHYRSVVVERNVYDYTNAVLDFGKGSADLDTLVAANAAELARIRGNMESMLGMNDYEADSVVVTASCSLEGSYRYNSSLAGRRAETVMKLLSESTGNGSAGILRSASIPENWKLFAAIVANDPSVSSASRNRILSLPYQQSPDSSETVLHGLPEYRYLREKIYPRLRTVRLDFYLHRKNMARDTVYTSELDSVYMKGVEALTSLDYSKAVEILGKYRDYNSALAYLSSGYDSKALEILDGLGDLSARALYLKALALSRLGREDEASEIYDKCVGLDPSMLHRGRLDPEIQMFTLKYE